MQLSNTRFKDRIYVTGFILVIISLTTFLLPFLIKGSINGFNYFIINFIITAFYFAILLITGRLRRGRDGLSPLLLFLVLFLISAYSLNRELNIFESSVSWLSVTLVLVCINYMAFSFYEYFPRFIKHLMCFVLGVGCCLFVYLAIYLVPLYLLSAVGFFLLGISLHSFVPLLFLLYSVRVLKRATTQDKRLKFSFYAGAVSVVVLLVVFITAWSNVTSSINKACHYATATNDNLPAWVSVAQTIPKNVLSERLLKTSLVYSVPDNHYDNFLWRIPSRNFEEQKKHDPLIMTASFFSGRLTLEENERIKVLESLYDSRHQAQERLWSGDNLLTEYVYTNVHIWPRFSLAYTEKTITVANLNNAEDRSSQEEAIFTFHLPEGGVVSALSLWINGKEEKGLLTTKEKAAKAYNTIVGIENRDPSVLHWQEGNTVSVRVFPVTSVKSRVFKIGITAPLQKKADHLAYDNIYFDGPSALRAYEDVSVSFDHKQETITAPAFLGSSDEQHFKSYGKYRPDWSINFLNEGLSPQGFNFNGKSYSVSPYLAERSTAVLNNIYLDINSSWTNNEFNDVYNLVKNKNVYVYSNTLIRLTASNKDQLFKQCASARFSLFPLFEIKGTTTALLISKSNATSPNLNDLGESVFLAKTKEHLCTPSRIKLFNMGSSLSPYLKTLLEYRVFDYEQGDLLLLEDLLAKSIFAVNKEDSNHVVIHNAALVIAESIGNVAAGAPDHLMRLFAYNHIMQLAGKKLLDSIPEDDTLIMEAKTASIVTPVSSLVVLETQKDYDRFNITESMDSLGNASLKSKGSVPEPHEWLLFITALCVLVYIGFKPALKITNTSNASN
ncbi:MAG: XrtN system VIT domain-containing protein [Chitinophagaceae bacterium]